MTRWILTDEAWMPLAGFEVDGTAMYKRDLWLTDLSPLGQGPDLHQVRVIIRLAAVVEEERQPLKPNPVDGEVALTAWLPDLALGPVTERRRMPPKPTLRAAQAWCDELIATGAAPLTEPEAGADILDSYLEQIQFDPVPAFFTLPVTAWPPRVACVGAASGTG